MYEYLGRVVRSEGGSLTEIGGVDDHVHLLVKLKPTMSIPAFLRVLKANSSKWIKEQDHVDTSFVWQEGYSAFTVSESQVQTVRRYVARQEEHHRERSYTDELRAICERHGVDFDPRFT